MIPNVRRPNQHDLNYIMDIDLKCFEDHWTLDVWRQQLMICNNSIYVATQNSTPVGFILWLKDEITRFAVKPTYRHKGLGSNLLEAVEADVQKQGINDIKIEIPESLCDPGKPIDISLWLLKRKFRARSLKHEGTTFCGVKEDVICFGKRLYKEI